MEEAFQSISRRVSNWGRWGKEDQRGTLNLITPDVLKRAAGAVKQGKLFRLGLDFASDGSQLGPKPCHTLDPRKYSSRRYNAELFMTAVSIPINADSGDFALSDDVIHLPSQVGTSWDGLAHVEYGGKIYNGFSASESISSYGACRCGVEHAASPGIMSRAVLLDIARMLGVDRLEPGFHVTPDHLEQACKAQGVSVESGDILMVRTGHMTWFTRDKNIPQFRNVQPGLTMECALWLHERNVAAVCADNTGIEHRSGTSMAQEAIPLPLHMLCIRDMGLHFGEVFDLEALAADCAMDGVYSFLLSAPVLPVRGAVGSAINPLALK